MDPRKVGRGPSIPVRTESTKPKTQKIKKEDAPKEKLSEKKLSEKEVKEMGAAKKRSSAFGAAAVQQALHEKVESKKPKLVKTTGHMQQLPYTQTPEAARVGRSRHADPQRPLPKAFATGDKKETFEVRNRLNTLLAGFMDAATATRHFHATRTNNLKGESGILKSGMQPRFGGSGAAKGSEQFEAQSKGKVHVTTKESRAIEYKDFFSKGESMYMPGKKTDASTSEYLRVNLTKKQRD